MKTITKEKSNMPLKKVAVPAAVKPKASVSSAVLILPMEKSQPKIDFLSYSYIVYGRKKIGKTTFASCFPDCLFLMTEPGAENLKVYQRPVRNWKEFVGYLDLLEKDKRFKTLVLDIGDPLYKWCLQHICDREGIDHPSDKKDFGATWDAITQEFQKQCNRVLPMNSGRGLVVISHEKAVEVEVVGEVSKLDRIIPTMEKHTFEFFNGKVDVIAYYTYKKKERQIIIRGDEHLESGCRLKYNFKTPSGLPVKIIKGGNSEEETFKNFHSAFLNQQPTTGEVKPPLPSQTSASPATAVKKKI